MESITGTIKEDKITGFLPELLIKEVPNIVFKSGDELMKTGALLPFRTGDDGDIQAGRDIDFFTIDDNNPFGNANRFTDELGTQIYANDIVIDWNAWSKDGTKVLGYDRRINAGNPSVNKSHNNAVDECLAHSNASYISGWRCTNRNELNNILNEDAPIWTDYAPFNLNVTNFAYVVSSVRVDGVSYIYFTGQGTILRLNRGFVAGGVRYIACRTFTVTGTVLT